MYSCAESIGKRIAEKRKEKNMTQENFSKLIGVNAKYVSAIERGRNIPRVDTLIRIMNVLEVEPNYIFMGQTSSAIPVRLNDIYEKLKHFPPERELEILRIFESIIKNLDRK